MALQQTVVAGQRTITRDRLAAPDRQREGRLDADCYRARVWYGDTIETVIEAMNTNLGSVDDAHYAVVEREA